ncbi:XRE family transcriptional regulator [Schlegelella sp. S2-27]|uniref:XRE family transcriptional regulator n=1 Tax=Caldimonas mangrovi TaxID=2944811 RepID=A0ABT0YP19_9BURK|nr:XRE family transcriptional regulator [Caldimonas mangrovi]MCM5680456.1 XRE family transcriptional regulator [Caldimonas mangrovi]
MKDRTGSLDQRIAHRVKALRTSLGLSLEALAARCDVSRSMISLIERGESSATAVVLERLATGLGVPLASLFDAPAPQPEPVARAAAQPWWRDPGSGYRRRNVSPAGLPSPIQIVEVQFPAGARVAYETGAREPRIHQQVWVLEGRIEVTVGDEVQLLDAGDCYAMTLDRPMAYRNPTRRPARYAVVIAAQAGARS